MVCNRTARSMHLVTPYAGQPGSPILYAATSTGLRESDDGCLTWKDVLAQGLLPSGEHIRWLAPYPNNRQILFAGMDGLGGLYRLTDAGNSWQGASQGLPVGAWVTSLAADLRQPSHILVGVRYTRAGAPSAYIYRSTDGGISWHSSSLGLRVLPNNGGGVIGLAWSGDTLFAATASDGLFSSSDRGDTWSAAVMPRRTIHPPSSLLPGAPVGEELPLTIRTFAANPEGALLMNTSEGAFQSLDGARTWRSFGPGEAIPGDTILAVEPNSGRVVLAGASAIWGYKVPLGVVTLPTITAAPTLEPTATRPPTAAVYTPSPIPPTATQTPTATPTVELVKGPLPTDRATPLDPSVSTYFDQTGHNLKSRLPRLLARQWWAGGLRLSTHGGVH